MTTGDETLGCTILGVYMTVIFIGGWQNGLEVISFSGPGSWEQQLQTNSAGCIMNIYCILVARHI